MAVPRIIGNKKLIGLIYFSIEEFIISFMKSIPHCPTRQRLVQSSYLNQSGDQGCKDIRKSGCGF
jgi:hypothetical protein